MNRLRELRNEKKLTTRELGEKLNISYVTISLLENGKQGFNDDYLRIFSKFFNTSTDYILGLSNERTPNEEKSLDEQLTEEMDGFQFALYDETSDLTDEQKEDLLQMIRIFKKNLKK